MSITKKLQTIQNYLQSYPEITLIVVTKKQSIPNIQLLYDMGIRDFGENMVQELLFKYPILPKDIQWHFIGHLQRNKVKYIAPFIHLIHSVDSISLLKEIEKQAAKNNKKLSCLLQVYIAKEKSKFGLSKKELEQVISHIKKQTDSSVSVEGLMGMATHSDEIAALRKEFASLKNIFDDLQKIDEPFICMKKLSMGMSNDYTIAIEQGSNMIRIGSKIFGV